MRAVFRWLMTNAPLMLMAFVLATLAWVVAVEDEDPTIERQYSHPIPISVAHRPSKMVIVGDFEGYTLVTLRAPRSVWDSLTPDDFSATVDLSGLEAGTHQVPVQVTVDAHPSRIIRIEPAQVTLELDYLEEIEVPVQVQVTGNPARGYLRRTTVIEPRRVTVVGPSTYISNVVKAVAQISVQDATDDVEATLPLRLQDKHAAPVPHVTATPSEVHVVIPIALSSYYRPLVVKVVPVGQVAPGYRITGISVEPPSVTVFGDPDVIAALPGYIETEPIDVEGARSDVVARPSLHISPTVSIVTEEQPTVRISIEAIQSSLTTVITPQIQGLRPGFTATVSPATVEVILNGPLPVLDTLSNDDVRLLIDLFGIEPGTYQIEPQILVPEGVVAQSINPATVQVEVTAR